MNEGGSRALRSAYSFAYAHNARSRAPTGQLNLRSDRVLVHGFKSAFHLASLALRERYRSARQHRQAYFRVIMGMFKSIQRLGRLPWHHIYRVLCAVELISIGLRERSCETFSDLSGPLRSTGSIS